MKKQPRRRRPTRRQEEQMRICRLEGGHIAIQAHNCLISRCGPVCTYGDW